MKKTKRNILLINPAYELEIRWITDQKDMKVKADYTPLGLGTVAALTPEDEFNVDIYDEFVRPHITEETQFDREYDLIGVTSCRANLRRAAALSKIFRAQGIPVAIGGPGVSGTPDRCRGHFDLFFIGEAELTWPRFLKEWVAGTNTIEYRQIDKPDIALSPMPKWDNIVPDLDKYAMGTVQTTRGCPFDCEFCDVVYLNGRRQRHKTVERVIEEVKVFERLGMKTIFFNDDNFVGNHRYAKEVLRALIPVNNAFDVPLRYATQASIDTARDEELMELLADANFYQLCIGIETPNLAALKETGKFQNLKGNLIEEVHKVLSFGIVLRGALIVGFDHDTPAIFQQQYDFIQAACLPSISLHLLNAPIGTRLWRRLRAEGRVIDPYLIAHKTTQRIFNNTIPKGMTHIQLLEGFKDLYGRVFSWDSFRERMRGFVSLVERPPHVRHEMPTLAGLAGLGPELGVGAEGCEAMAEIFRFTHETCPEMLERVKELVIQFIKYAEDATGLLPQLQQQIDAEASGELVFPLDQRPITIPAAFRDAYDSLFHDAYRRAYANMADKTQVPLVLTESLVELLVHEENIERWQDHHTVLLVDIIDRTCARFSDDPSGTFRAVTPDDSMAIPDPKKMRLGDDIIKSVEQQLLILQTAKTEQAPV